MRFSLVVDGSEFEGIVQSQGESFRLTNSQLELYCNGTTKWIYNIDNKELTIMPNDLSQTDLMENPMAFLTSLGKGYSYNEKPVETTESGKTAWKIEMKTVNKKLAYTSITLIVEKSTLKPLAVEYLAKNGTLHVARIPYLVGKRPWPAGYFSFPQSRMNGLSVTDLR
jgi:outer membrane lipoprotein-sorting protein